mmetsp:Transcript_36064/g.103671  ORF Transcript_36064/g.103671 Transcript_36064/m.103671 type:complete len:336 (+) Transcript_36064:74-1081(+)
MGQFSALARQPFRCHAAGPACVAGFLQNTSDRKCGHGEQPHDHENATKDCQKGGHEVIPGLAVALDRDGERLQVVEEARLRYDAGVQPRGPPVVVEEIAHATPARAQAHDLQVVLVGLVEGLRAIPPAVDRRQVGHVEQGDAEPALRRRVARLGESQLLDRVRHVRRRGVEVLVPAARRQLQVARHARHPQEALQVAPGRQLPVMLLHAMALLVHESVNPAHHSFDGAVAVVARKGAVGLVQPERGEGVDPVAPADVLEVHAVHLDGRHLPDLVVDVDELLGLHLAGNLVPRRRKLPAVDAPLCEEVDQREVVELYDVLEALVLEAVVGGRPVSI